jgi:UDPglucose 6-dehydrogenase
MKVGFLGLGKLGLPCALAMESKGHTIYGYDVNDRVIQSIIMKKLKYKEKWADELLYKSKINLSGIVEMVQNTEIIFVAIQTPHQKKYEGITRLPNERVDFDYSYLKAGIQILADIIKDNGQSKIVVIISTVLPGTIRKEIKPLLNEFVKLCYNPYFIAMGTCIPDFLFTEINLLGVDDVDAAEKVKKFYSTINEAPTFDTTIENAELIKVCYNTFISTKISMMNTIMEVCHKLPNTNVDSVTRALSLCKDRIISGKYLTGGMGDGGGCHPRDNIALSHLSRRLHLSYDWFENIMIQREKQTEWLADLFIEESKGRKMVILGTSFKPETNIITGSPALLLKNLVEEKGYKVTVFDPYVDLNVTYTDEQEESLITYFIGTKHEIFKHFPFKQNSTVIDPFRYIARRNDLKIIKIGNNIE